MILNKAINQKLLNEIHTVLSYESSRSSWKNKFESKEFKAAAAIGEKVGSPLNRSLNCGCIDDLFIVLKLIIKQNKKPLENMNKEQSKFRIKNDGMIQCHGIEPITNDNLTDEKAVELLKKNKKHISNFDVYPKDWESMISEGTKKKAAPKKGKAKKEKEESTEDAPLKNQDGEEIAAADEVPSSSNDEVTEEEQDVLEKIEEAEVEESKEQTREEELLAADKPVLKALANSLFEAGKAPKKPHHNAGVEKLVEFIMEYENK